MNTATRVDPQRDSLVESVNAAVGRSLSTAEFKTLESAPNTWHEQLHIKALLNMYVDKIRLRSIRVRVVDSARLQEPIILYFHRNNKGRADDTVVHTVCADYVKMMFCTEPLFAVHSVKRRVKEFRLPRRFNIGRATGRELKNQLSAPLSQKLSLLYCLADHAAYHYFAYELHKKADYEHRERYRIPGEFFLHELFSREKDARVASILSDDADRGGTDGQFVYTFGDDDDDDDSGDDSSTPVSCTDSDSGG